MNDEHLNVVSTETEALPSYLKRRERELIQQTAAIRGMLIPKEKELADVRQAMQAVGIQPSYASQMEPFLEEKDAGSSSSAASHTVVTIPERLIVNGVVVSLTIKEMILAGMKDHFHNGATPIELRDYFKAVYGRDIDRNSISPQLARLRDNGMIEQSPEGFWRRPKSASEKQVKEMVIQALLNRFHKDATVKAFHDYIHEEYGRSIEIPNLLRQLHSLRESEILTHNINSDSWSFAPKKREVFMMYDHPSMREAMRELRDDSDSAAESADTPHKMPWE
jgi:DNA-binding transcriptional ArsR family regulator